MGDDGIDMVISHIDMGYLVTLRGQCRRGMSGQGRGCDESEQCTQIRFEQTVKTPCQVRPRRRRL
jgi:hypothetical protein